MRTFGHGLFHGVLDAGKIAFFHQVSHQLGVEHDFHGRNACAFHRAHQALRDDGFEGRGQVTEHGGSHLGRVEAQNAVERLVAVVAVQGSQAQVARLRIRDGRGHGFPVTDFADQNHVRGLAQGVLEGGLQRLGVTADLALVHDRFLVAELVFHRVFDGENVPRHQGVARVDHGGQGGAFARARSAHHQDQAALFQNQFGQNGRQVQRFKIGHLLRDEANHHGIAAALAHGADTEAPDAGNRHAHVQLAGFLQLFNALGGDDFRQQVARSVWRQHLVVDRYALAVDLDQRRGVGRQVNV